MSADPWRLDHNKDSNPPITDSQIPDVNWNVTFGTCFECIMSHVRGQCSLTLGEDE
jgi:hypothetical protein